MSASTLIPWPLGLLIVVATLLLADVVLTLTRRRNP